MFSPSPRILAALITLVLWGLITHASYAGTGDEPHYMMMAYSLAFDHTLDLAGKYGNPDNRALSWLDAGDHVRAGKDGRLRPVHDVGLPLLFAPYYAVAYEATAFIVDHAPEGWLRRARLTFTVLQRHFLSLAMIGITAWMGVSLLATFVDLSRDATRAFAWAALLVLSPPILSHSFLFFTEILSGFIALRVLLWLRGSPASRGAALLAGGALGYLLLVHVRNAGLVAGLLGIAVYRSSRWPNGRAMLAWFTAGASAMFLARTLVTYDFWGTWLTTPHARFETATGWLPFMGEALTRLAGWLFDQEHGLLPYAPIYLLLPLGCMSLWRLDRELSIETSVVVAAYVGTMALPVLNPHGWRGGWTPAARFLVPVAPFLAIVVFAAVARVRRLPLAVRALALVQIGIDVILWRRPGLLWNDGTGTSALLSYLDRGSGRLSQYLPSLSSPTAERTLIATAACIVAWALLTVWIARSEALSKRCA
jgi:hypothetical protein